MNENNGTKTQQPRQFIRSLFTCITDYNSTLRKLGVLLSQLQQSPYSFIDGGVRAVLMSVGLPSVCLSVPAVQEQKVCTASVDRQTHHNSLFLSLLMSWEEGRTEYRERNQEDFLQRFHVAANKCLLTFRS